MRNKEAPYCFLLQQLVLLTPFPSCGMLAYLSPNARSKASSFSANTSLLPNGSTTSAMLWVAASTWRVRVRRSSGVPSLVSAPGATSKTLWRSAATTEVRRIPKRAPKSPTCKTRNMIAIPARKSQERKGSEVSLFESRKNCDEKHHESPRKERGRNGFHSSHRTDTLPTIVCAYGSTRDQANGKERHGDAGNGDMCNPGGKNGSSDVFHSFGDCPSREQDGI